MKLKNLILSSAQMLGLQDVVDAVAQGNTDVNSNYNILKRCANLVITNIAAAVVDCIARQNFTVTNQKIDNTQFANNLLRVISVSCNGAEINFEHFAGHIAVPNGSFEVTYAYVPNYINPDDEIAIPNVSESTLIYGTIAEYAFVSGMFNEAKIWNEKYGNQLFEGIAKRKKATLPRGQ